MRRHRPAALLRWLRGTHFAAVQRILGLLVILFSLSMLPSMGVLHLAWITYKNIMNC